MEPSTPRDLNAYKFDFLANQAASTLDTIIAPVTLEWATFRAQNNFNAYRQIPSQGKGKGPFYLLSELLPHKNQQWGFMNNWLFIVEARSSLPEIQAK